MYFLGEIYVDLALPATAPVAAHCGRCTACIDVCPTQAIVAPYRLDARRCISYLTIEHDGPIPVELRAAMGNRIYGCDDCQLVCPWNKYATVSTLPDFDVRHGLDRSSLLDLWAWDEDELLAAHRRQRDAPRRLVALAAQPGGGARQRLARRRRSEDPRCTASLHATMPTRWCANTSTGRWRSADQGRNAASAVSASGRLAMPSSVDSVTRLAT